MRRDYSFLQDIIGKIYDKIIRRIYDRIRGYEDYLNVPFSIHDPLPPSAERVMDICCNKLEENGIKYYVYEGTALGFYREGGFIKHDDDIDVAIPVETELDTHVLLKWFVDDLGMHIGRKLTYRGKLQQLLCYDDDKVPFDMCFFWKDENEDYIYLCPECKCPYRLDKKYFGTPFVFNFHGRRYPLFSHIEEWLRYRYGDEWKIPETSKGDWREDPCFK